MLAGHGRAGAASRGAGASEAERAPARALRSAPGSLLEGGRGGAVGRAGRAGGAGRRRVRGTRAPSRSGPAAAAAAATRLPTGWPWTSRREDSRGNGPKGRSG